MIRLFKHYISYNVVLLSLIDLMLLSLAGEAAWRLRVAQIGISAGQFSDRVLEIGGFAGVIWLAMIAVGTYGPEALRSMRFATARLLVAVSLGVLAISLMNFFLPGSALWRSVLRAERLERLSRRPDSGFAVGAFVAMGESEPTIDTAVARESISDLGRFVERVGATEVVLALQERRNSLPLKDLLRVKTKGVMVSDFSSFLERELGRVDLDTLNPSWLIFSDGFSSGRRLSSIGKRLFDILVSLVILIVGLPLVAIFAILVKLESKGPAFFRQTRVGLYGQEFTLVKLRSMRTDAEADGARWADKDDPRITRVGRLIRMVRIDELPQVWSVLKGEMSFVGPRPEVPAFVVDLEKELPFYAERHMVKPGITGWAQINYPYGASVEDSRQKLEYDLYYAKNYTPFLDIIILLQTARVIIWPEGAR